MVVAYFQSSVFFLTARSAVLPAPEHHQCCCGAAVHLPQKQWSDLGLDPSPHQPWALDASKVLVIIEQWIQIVYEHCSKFYGVILTISNQYILIYFGYFWIITIHEYMNSHSHLSCRYPTTGWCPASIARSNGVVLPLEVLENLQPKCSHGPPCSTHVFHHDNMILRSPRKKYRDFTHKKYETKLRLGPLLHQLRQGAKVSEMRRVVDGFASKRSLGSWWKNCGAWNVVMNLSWQVD